MKLLLVLLGLVAALPAAEDGGQPVAWSGLARGARGAALGQAVTALADDSGAAFLNPALAVTRSETSLGSQSVFLPDGRQVHGLGLLRPFWRGADWSWSLAYTQYQGDDAIEKRSGNTPTPEGTFAESASLSQLGVAAHLADGRAALGAAVKLYSHALDAATAGGLAGDVGVWFQATPWLDLGLGIQDLGGRLTWSTGRSESLAWRLRAGLHVQVPTRDLGLLLEGERQDGRSPRLRAGGEWWPWKERVALRLGWDGSNPAAGLGVRWPLGLLSAGLDYALAADPMGGAALQHRFSFELSASL